MVSQAIVSAVRQVTTGVMGQAIRHAIPRITPEIAEGVTRQVNCGITRSVIRSTAAGVILRRLGVGLQLVAAKGERQPAALRVEPKSADKQGAV
jgi:hypothetical protein